MTEATSYPYVTGSRRQSARMTFGGELLNYGLASTVGKATKEAAHP